MAGRGRKKGMCQKEEEEERRGEMQPRAGAGNGPSFSWERGQRFPVSTFTGIPPRASPGPRFVPWAPLRAHPSG